MEEIIGEINDEFDEVDAPYVKLDDHTYVFEGKMMISEVCNIMELSEDTFDSVKGDSETLAGLVLEIAGEIPQKDEVVTAGDFDFTVMEIEKNRLQKIKIAVRQQTNG
jgi:CBS domain containing-hemolysin-like protein